MRHCTICHAEITYGRTNSVVCGNACREEHKRQKAREYSKRYYHKNSSKIIEKRRAYGREWRIANPEYHREANKQYNKVRTARRKETHQRVVRVISKCGPERAVRICQMLLDSPNAALQDWVRSYAGDDLISSYVE